MTRDPMSNDIPVLWWCRPVAVSGVCLILYLATTVPYFPPVGDAGDYASLIEHGVLSIRGGHVGYYLIMIPPYRLLTAMGVAGDLR